MDAPLGSVAQLACSCVLTPIHVLGLAADHRFDSEPALRRFQRIVVEELEADHPAGSVVPHHQLLSCLLADGLLRSNPEPCAAGTSTAVGWPALPARRASPAAGSARCRQPRGQARSLTRMLSVRLEPRPYPLHAHIQWIRCHPVVLLGQPLD